MRLILILCLFFIPLAGCATSASEPVTVDGIVSRYIDAIGGYQRIKAIDNLVYRNGTYREGDYSSDGDATMSMARPWYKLVGDKNAPGTFMEGYDGAAWEWFGDPGFVIRTVGPASEAARHYAGVEHPLVDFRARGSTARLVGETVLDGSRVIAIELTRRDGFAEQFYIDTSTWLIVASGAAAPIHAFGDTVQRLTRFDDYRRVAGVLLPHRSFSVQMPSGKPLHSMQWGTIEANVNLPPDWFSPPQFERTPLQAFIEHLYTQRADVDAVLWTCHEFRRAWPEVDIAGAVNIAGFQILKMGASETAIALLHFSVDANPECGDCYFGLGRAWDTAGQPQKAREVWQRGLKAAPGDKRIRQALMQERS